jgi:hypothetical protein
MSDMAEVSIDALVEGALSLGLPSAYSVIDFATTLARRSKSSVVAPRNLGGENAAGQS